MRVSLRRLHDWSEQLSRMVAQLSHEAMLWEGDDVSEALVDLSRRMRGLNRFVETAQTAYRRLEEKLEKGWPSLAEGMEDSWFAHVYLQQAGALEEPVDVGRLAAHLQELPGTVISIVTPLLQETEAVLPAWLTARVRSEHAPDEGGCV